MQDKNTSADLILKIQELNVKASEQKYLEDVYRSVVESTSDSIYFVDEDCRYLFINNHYLSRLGQPIEQIIGRKYGEFHSQEEDREFSETVRKVSAAGESHQLEHRSTRDGKYFFRTFSPVREHSGHGKITGVVVFSKDITEFKRAEDAIRESEQKYKAILENIEDGYQEVDLSGNVIFFNDSILKMLGYSRAEFARMNYRDFIDEVTATEIFQILNEIYETGNPFRGVEIEVIKWDGSKRNVELFISLMKDAKGNATGFRNFIRDITERKRSEETIKRLAYHDPLTGLPNRLLFRDRLNMAIARAKRNRQYLSVMMLDLDNFKDINDTLGHHVGDQLLQSVGNRMTGLLRRGDTISRMGGDEFLILLPEIQKIEDTHRVVKKIIETFRMPFLIDNRELRITTSIGIATYPKDSEDVDTLIKNADIAMYHAKASGRNDYKLFNQDMITKTSA